MNNDVFAKFDEHFDALLGRYQSLLADHKYDYAVIPSGMPIRKYLDDMDYPFKTNPHFKAILPLADHPHCQIVIPQSGKPTLCYYQPVDFWHTVPSDPEGPWTKFFDIKIIARPADALAHIPKKGRVILLGEQQGVLDAVSFSAHNPETIVYPLYWQRAYKSDYEIECIMQSNIIATRAHNAARDAFYNKESEQGIHLAYLKAAKQLENDMPYGNIVALNNNGAILHYTGCEGEVPKQHHSFLIDAGAQFHGYASDITRTYSFAKNDEFADMIKTMDDMHLGLLDKIKPGASYVDLHIEAHHKIAAILKQYQFVDMEPASQVEAGITSVFFPHGLGHQLGLQVHDVGGHQTNGNGGTTNPPAEHPFLRNTREIEASQVLTVEPGLYFIDSLLADIKSSEFDKQVNWKKIDEFKKFGGIRIEDDIVVTDKGHRNLTREAFDKL